MTARYDLIVYGATGRTGTQVVERLTHAGAAATLRWAVAGRTPEKLARLRRDLPPSMDVLECSLDDRVGLRRLVESARVVLNLAGPYVSTGEALVGTCARHGVDYLDISGETAHVRRLIDRYHEEAAGTGAKIVPFCGFDSVPSDLGALLVVEHDRSRGLSTREVKGFFQVRAGLNSGTVASMLEAWRRPADVRAMDDPMLLSPDEAMHPAERARHADPLLPVLDPDLGRWVAPFGPGPINTRVVRRSRALAADQGEDYGPGFRYQEYWDPGGPASLVSSSAAAWGMAAYRLTARVPGAAEVLAPLLGRGERGPIELPQEDGFFRALFVGTATDGSKTWAEISDRSDPSNEATVRIVCECALALALDRERLPGGAERAGVLTPAAAFGLGLAERLRAIGFTLECPAPPY